MATQILDPISLLMLANAQMFSRNLWETNVERPTITDVARLASHRASPYGTITIEQPQMSWDEFIQAVIIPVVSDFFVARELSKPVLDDRIVRRLRKQIPDLDRYLQKDEKTDGYRFIDVDNAPEMVKEIYNKVKEIEEARQRLLRNPRNFLRPGTLSLLMQNPIITSTVFDVAGQIERGIRAGKKKEAMRKIASKTLQGLGLKEEELEVLNWEDFQMLMPFILVNLFSNLKPKVTSEVR
ncbi:TPA: hypothetical protein [Aquificae Conch Spring virus]|nr:TPA: hypothetical protein [Aquificae Conch Spring virus]